MDFVAIDVETANADVSSICQIGIASCKDGAICGEWKTYVDPEDYFDPMNIQIHRIDEVKVKGAPTFKHVADELSKHLNGRVIVCHTHFDRISIERSTQKYSIAVGSSSWLDSARVARRTWKECSSRGYGLADVCKRIGYDFKHHDALEDAKASAHIMFAAMRATGLSIDEWLKRVTQPIDPSAGIVRREGNPDGPLFGEILVFTGALNIPRKVAADLAAVAGCTVGSGVTKDTTLLVVGDQDIQKLNGKVKSSKHLKAEQLIQKGQSIRILRESDFAEIVRLVN